VWLQIQTKFPDAHVQNKTTSKEVKRFRVKGSILDRNKAFRRHVLRETDDVIARLETSQIKALVLLTQQRGKSAESARIAKNLLNLMP
jgi:ribosomal protein L35